MATQPHKAGSEIKYHCPRCELDLWHTVIAVTGGQPARVRCNTCKSERNYKAPRLSGGSDRPTPRAITRTKVVGAHPDLYQQKLRALVMKSPKPYRIDAAFEVDDLIDHIKFGRGVVLKLIHPDRMDVLFQDESRTLVCKLPA